MTRLLYDGKVDVALIHGQGGAREALNLELLCGVMLGADPVVGLRQERSLANLGKKLSNLSGNSLVIWTFRTAEFVGQDVASIEWQWVWNYVEGCRAFIDQLVKVRNRE